MYLFDIITQWPIQNLEMSDRPEIGSNSLGNSLDIKIQAVTEFKADAEREYNKEWRELEKVWKQGSRIEELEEEI